MVKLTPLMASFNGGEWSEEIWGRSDIQKYPNAAKKQKNFISLPSGMLKPRPGTRFVSTTKDNLTARIIPFEFSRLQAYILEFTNFRMRVFKDNGIVDTIPGTPYEIASPYSESQLPNIKYAQSNNVLYIAHPSIRPKKLTRTGHTNWTFTDIQFIDGPYLDRDTSIDTTQLTPSATTGAITITASANLFVATDVGRLVRIKNGATWGWAEITAYISATQVSASVKSDFAAVTATKEWRLGAWSDTTGWPSVVVFYERRIFYANSATQPQTLWGSTTDDFENFAPSKIDNVVVASNALTYTIDDNQVHNIQWLVSSERLMIGTSSAEFIAQASTLNEGLTPTNITIRSKSRIGSANIMPVLIDQSIIYVQTAARSIYELIFENFDSPTNSVEMSIFSNHLLTSGVREITYQKRPWSLLWGCCHDGRLFAATFVKDQQVLAFHDHPIGGKNVKVISVACIPNETGNQLWLVVERFINGNVVRYVEYMTDDYLPKDKNDKSGFVFMDSSLEYNGAPVSLIYGLGHLKGESVQILADGAAHADQIVAIDGSLNINRKASRIQIGLKTESIFETLDLEPLGQFGSTLIQKKRINKLAIVLSNSLGGKINNEYIDYNVMYRSPSMPMDQSPPLFTGKILVSMPVGYSDLQSITIKRDQPLPLNILAISPSINITEED